MTTFDLDGLCRDIMAMNEANAAMYRRMEMPRNPYARPLGEYCAPMRPDTELVPGRDDLAALDEMPVCDPPLNPISDRDGD